MELNYTAMLTWPYTPIVVSTVDEKNTACNILHFSSTGGKFLSTSSDRPLEDASSKTCNTIHIEQIVQNPKHSSGLKQFK
jgi:hypothetical protein